MISAVGDRLRQIDPERWDSVPITWETKFGDVGGHYDIRTSIHIHEALEREFGIEVNDKRMLIQSFPEAWYVLGNSHDGI
jgi:hypothetical protein